MKPKSLRGETSAYPVIYTQFCVYCGLFLHIGYEELSYVMAFQTDLLKLINRIIFPNESSNWQQDG